MSGENRRTKKHGIINQIKTLVFQKKRDEALWAQEQMHNTTTDAYMFRKRTQMHL
jgi:hypothetical protein